MNAIAALKRVLKEFRPANQKGSYWANCPFCAMMGEERLDTRQRLGITLRGTTRAAHCFNCGWKGTVNQLLKALGNKTLSKVELRRAQSEGGPEKEKPKEFTPQPLPEGFLPIDDPRCIGARQYLNDRGFADELLVEYGFGYARRGYFARRVIIPLKFGGMTVGYQGRLLVTPKKSFGRKYMFNEGFDASRALFNFDKMKGADEVVVVEGAFDCLRHLSNRGVALFTNKMSDRQKVLLISNFKSIVVMLDQGYEEEAMKVAKELQGFVPTRIALLPPGEDPASATREQIDEAIAGASRPSLKMRLTPLSGVSNRAEGNHMHLTPKTA